MPARVCRCGGAGWDGCRPAVSRDRELDAELRHELCAALQRVAADDRDRVSMTFGEALRRVAANEVRERPLESAERRSVPARSVPPLALPASPAPMFDDRSADRRSRYGEQ